MQQLSLTDRVFRSGDLVETRVDKQTLMMSIEQGRYYALERTGQRIWELISEPVEVSAIVDTLMDEYDVERETCTAQVLGFLDDMARNGLVSRAAH